MAARTGSTGVPEDQGGQQYNGHPKRAPCKGHSPSLYRMPWSHALRPHNLPLFEVVERPDRTSSINSGLAGSWSRLSLRHDVPPRCIDLLNIQKRCAWSLHKGLRRIFTSLYETCFARATPRCEQDLKMRQLRRKWLFSSCHSTEPPALPQRPDQSPDRA